MRVTFSTFVTPTRDSETWIAGADACTSATWGRGVGSIDPGAYRGGSARSDSTAVGRGRSWAERDRSWAEHLKVPTRYGRVPDGADRWRPRSSRRSAPSSA